MNICCFAGGDPPVKVLSKLISALHINDVYIGKMD